jgi:hypothetical protein
MADYKVETRDPVFNEGSYNRWTCRFPETEVELPYESVEKIGRIFVYLMDGGKPICYYKGDAKDFEGDDAPI